MIERVVLIICLLMLCTSSIGQAQGQRDWSAEYSRLQRRMQEHRPEPRGTPRELAPYLHWMEVKAADRDEVDALLQEVNTLSVQNPEDMELADWVQKFFVLSRQSQESGDGTVNEAALKFLRWGHGTDFDSWLAVMSQLKGHGRKIFLKARETGFSTKMVVDNARCMVRFATADIELGSSAIWFGRDGFLGWIDEDGFQHSPAGDIQDDCSRRADQTLTAEGKPMFPVDSALEKTRLIREEAEWWGFQGELKDIIDLENDYYKDALCQEPPHKKKMGHDWFRDVAEKNELDESIEHNQGFYGTLFGHVHVRMPDGDQPASGARVTASSGGESWSTTADRKGNYELDDVVLHESCSPHSVSATHEGDRVDDTYDGPLSEPETGARHRKDLLIIPETVYAWTGTLTLRSSKELHCEAQKEGPGEAMRTLSLHESRVQLANIQVYAEALDETGAGFNLMSGSQLHVTGTMRSRIANSREQYNRSGSGESRILERSSMKGSSSSELSDSNLVLQVTRTDLMDSARSMQSVVQQFQQGKISPEAFQKKMAEALQPGREDSYTVEVMVQVTVLGQGPVTVTDYREVHDQGRTRVERDDRSTRQMSISLPLAIRMSGRYTKEEHGRATLTASVRDTETSPPGGVWDCPERVTTVTGELNMSRTRKRP